MDTVVVPVVKTIAPVVVKKSPRFLLICNAYGVGGGDSPVF